jgi:hypothetical protein
MLVAYVNISYGLLWFKDYVDMASYKLTTTTLNQKLSLFKRRRSNVRSVIVILYELSAARYTASYIIAFYFYVYKILNRLQQVEDYVWKWMQKNTDYKYIKYSTT